ncbi:hypothetical protein ACSLOE_30495, partial [Escherichia coli]|uniref:hypothetical protein n=1 Tax=Escherichia coli TaxID=562 RepID=UPI003EDF9468
LVITHAPCLRVQLLQTLFLLAENIHIRVYLHALVPQQTPGRGSGPVDYLLGRERNREGATVLQGNPEEVRELIDATPFAKKYT